MKVIAKLSTRLFNSDAVRDAFFAGWVDAGGTNGDCETHCPWCAPWHWAHSIRIDCDADQPTPDGLTDEEAQASPTGTAY